VKLTESFPQERGHSTEIKKSMAKGGNDHQEGPTLEGGLMKKRDKKTIEQAHVATWNYPRKRSLSRFLPFSMLSILLTNPYPLCVCNSLFFNVLYFVFKTITSV